MTMVSTTGICLGLIAGFMFMSLDRVGHIRVILGRVTLALINAETSIAIVTQKHHLYTGNLNLETPGDSKDGFLHCGDIFVIS